MRSLAVSSLRKARYQESSSAGFRPGGSRRRRLALAWILASRAFLVGENLRGAPAGAKSKVMVPKGCLRCPEPLTVDKSDQGGPENGWEAPEFAGTVRLASTLHPSALVERALTTVLREAVLPYRPGHRGPGNSLLPPRTRLANRLCRDFY